MPELLRPSKPEFEWDYRDNLRFEYRYDFMPAGIITRFIVRTHDIIKEEIYWKNGVVLQRENTEALIISERLNRKIRIWVSGDKKKELLAIIRREFDYIHKTLNDPEVTEMIPCICSECVTAEHPHFYEYETLCRFRTKGKIACKKSTEDVSIEKLLGDYERPEDKRKAEYLERGEIEIEVNPHIEVSPKIEQKPTIEIAVAAKKHKWWKNPWAIIAGIIVLLGGIWSAIQIYESKTFQSIYHNSKGKNQIPAEKELLDDYGRTPLYARTKKRIDDIYEKIENEKLNPWIFINTGVKLQITEYNGKVISYEGVTFEGAPRVIFWSDDFIPPFIEDAIIKVFDQTIEECRKNNLDPEPYISEAKSLLYGFINKVYSRMAYIDQKLSSKGGSSKVGLKDVSFQIDKMNECLKKHYDAAVLLVSKDRNLKNAD